MWSIQNLSLQDQISIINYNILNIVVNTELVRKSPDLLNYYNILNIVVNTEQSVVIIYSLEYYNILNIVVNTERFNVKR